MQKVLTIKEYERMTDEYAKVKYQCKNCGYKVIIPYKEKKKLCSWCKHYVFKNPQDEFRYRLECERKKWDENKLLN